MNPSLLEPIRACRGMNSRSGHQPLHRVAGLLLLCLASLWVAPCAFAQHCAPGGTSEPPPVSATVEAEWIKACDDLKSHRLLPEQRTLSSSERYDLTDHYCRGNSKSLLPVGLVIAVKESKARRECSTTAMLERASKSGGSPQRLPLGEGMYLCEGDVLLTWRDVNLVLQLFRIPEGKGLDPSEVKLATTYTLEPLSRLELGQRRQELTQGRLALLTDTKDNRLTLALGNNGHTLKKVGTFVWVEVLDACKGRGFVTLPLQGNEGHQVTLCRPGVLGREVCDKTIGENDRLALQPEDQESDEAKQEALRIANSAYDKLLPELTAAITNFSTGADWHPPEWVTVSPPVPPDAFYQGSNENNEHPIRKVTLKAFELSKTEVTVEQYGDCVTAGKCTEPATTEGCNWGKTNRSKHPVNCVTYRQAEIYANWVGEQLNQVVRLPSESEWEYAARGPKNNVYPWGNEDASDERANRNSSRLSTTEIGQFPKGKSWVGALDMAGNVWEWTQDCYRSEYDQTLVDGSPRVCPSTDPYRAIRGGGDAPKTPETAAAHGSSGLRGASRRGHKQDEQEPDLGIRLVKQP